MRYNVTMEKNKRAMQIAIRFNPEEAEIVRQAARRLGWSVSQVIRHAFRAMFMGGPGMNLPKEGGG